MSTSARIIRNTSYLYMKMAITMFVSLYTTRLILNSLGANDFGIFNVVGGAIAMLGFVNQAMASATQRFMSYSEGEDNNEKKCSIFNISLLLHIFIALFVMILLLFAALFFFNGILRIEDSRMFAAKVVYGCLIVSTMLTVMNVPYDAVMNAHENMLYFSIVGIIEAMLKLLVAFACVYTTHDKLIVYGILMACIPAITLTIMKVYCHHHYNECVIAPRKYFDYKLMKEMTSFAGWNFLSTFAALISGHGSNIILNHFFGATLNAANGVTGQLNGQLQALGNTLLKALNPVLVKSEGAQEREKMFVFAFTGAKMTVCMFAFFAIPVVIDRDYILHSWLKNVPPYTSDFIKYLLIWTFFSQIAGTIGTTISAIGNIKRVSELCTCILLSNIILLYVAFSIGFNPEIFMILSCLTQAARSFIYIYYGRKLGRMNVQKYMIDVFLRVAIGIVTTYIIIYVLWSIITPCLFRLVFICISSFITYSILFYIVTLNNEERFLINKLTLKMIQKIYN